MLDTKTLSTELTGVVGLYAGFGSTSDLPADTHRDPSVFLSDAHKLLRPDLLADLGPQLSSIKTVSFELSATYAKYELVSSDQNGERALYESRIAGNTNTSVTDQTAWLKTTMLSAWYGRIERGAVDKLARALAESPPAKPLLDRQALFGKESNLQGVINKSGSFLGYKLRLVGRNTTLNIARLGLQVTGPLNGMPLYIFHSESAEPVAIITLTGQTSNRTIWANPNRYLFEQWTGYFLIGYFEGDLPSGVSAVGGQRYFQPLACPSCDPVDYQLALNRSPYLHITPVYVQNVGTSRLMDWVPDSELTVSTQTWGINLVIDARCDVTQALLTNREMLTNALLYTVACDVLEELSTSDRVNGTAAQFKNAAYVALYGQANSKTDFGLSAKRDKTIKDLKAIMATMSPNCMAAEVKPETIRFESMFACDGED